MATSSAEAVLFACGLNRIRSPMAAGLMRRLHGDRLVVDSCGLRADPDALLDPFTFVVMDEIGVDLSAHEPKTFLDLEDRAFDVIVSLSPEAQHGAIEYARGRRTSLEYWPTLDPTLVTGSRETVLDAYRDVRKGLEARIRERFPPTRTFGG